MYSYCNCAKLYTCVHTYIFKMHNMCMYTYIATYASFKCTIDTAYMLSN